MMSESVIWNKDRDSRDDENGTNYTDFRRKLCIKCLWCYE